MSSKNLLKLTKARNLDAEKPYITIIGKGTKIRTIGLPEIQEYMESSHNRVLVRYLKSMPHVHMKSVMRFRRIFMRIRYDMLKHHIGLHNSIDINYYNGFILRIDCGKAEDGLITTPNSQRLLDALAIDKPLEYARLYLNHEMQDWVSAVDIDTIF